MVQLVYFDWELVVAVLEGFSTTSGYKNMNFWTSFEPSTTQ